MGKRRRQGLKLKINQGLRDEEQKEEDHNYFDTAKFTKENNS